MTRLPHHHLLIIVPFSHASLTLRLPYLFVLYSSLFYSPRLPRRSSSHPSVPYHYYEPSGPDECSMYLSHERSRRGSHHRFITEKMVFANWARTLNIHFYQPDWKPTADMSLNRSYAPFLSGSWDSLKIFSRSVKYVCGCFPDCSLSPPPADISTWDSSRTEYASVAAV